MKLLQRLRAYGYRLQYLLPRSDWQGSRLQQLQVDFAEGRLQTDTFTDRFGTYPDLPFVEDIPSACHTDRCAVLEAQINALQAKIFNYRSHLGQALVHYAVYPHRPGALELPRLVCEPGLLDRCSFDELMDDLAEGGLVPQAPIAYFLGLLFFPPHLSLPQAPISVSVGSPAVSQFGRIASLPSFRIPVSYSLLVSSPHPTSLPFHASSSCHCM